jgi:PKHD-type hydroxylase
LIAFKIKTLENYAQWASFEGAFSAKECEEIKSMFDESQVEKAVTGQNTTPNHEIRKNDLCWIKPAENNHWIFKKLADIVNGCNEARWQFNLNGFFEPLQLTRYQIANDHYSWHADSGPADFSIRKLSCVVQLSNPDEYQGCELEFLGHEKESVPKSVGSLIIFPSYNAHRVTPLISGKRQSLVAWVSGPPYK